VKKNQALIKFSFLLILVICLVMFDLGMWCVDIGVSGMMLGKPVESGFWTRDPKQEYHIGLWLLGVGSVLLALMLAIAVAFGEFRFGADKGK